MGLFIETVSSRPRAGARGRTAVVRFQLAVAGFMHPGEKRGQRWFKEFSAFCVVLP